MMFIDHVDDDDDDDDDGDDDSGPAEKLHLQHASG